MFVFFVLAYDWDSVCVEDHASGGFIGAGQVVEVFTIGVAACVGHLLILIHTYHQALVADRLHVILVAVRRLVQGTLRQRHRRFYSKTAVYGVSWMKTQLIMLFKSTYWRLKETYKALYFLLHSTLVT